MQLNAHGVEILWLGQDTSNWAGTVQKLHLIKVEAKILSHFLSLKNVQPKM